MRSHGEKNCCPFCDSADIQFLRSVLSPYNQATYQLIACQICGLHFFAPLVFEDVYSTESVSEYIQFHRGRMAWPSWTQAALLVIGQLKLPMRERKILEIGAGDGVNFAALQQTYDIQPANYYVVELDRKSVAQCQQRGITHILNTVFDTLTARSFHERFDRILVFEVLEHQTHPKEFLEAAFSLLTPEGLLILTVPNRDRYFLRQREFQGDLPPHHFLRFNAWFFQKNFAGQLYYLQEFPQKYKIANIPLAATKLATQLNLPKWAWRMCVPCLPLVKVVMDGMAYIKGEGLIVILRKGR